MPVLSRPVSSANLLSLPDELLMRIFAAIPNDGHLERRRDLPPTSNSVTLVCRRFDDLLRPGMYKHVAFCHAGGWESFRKCLQSPDESYPDTSLTPSKQTRRISLMSSLESLTFSFECRSSLFERPGKLADLPNLKMVQMIPRDGTITSTRDVLSSLSYLNCSIHHLRIAYINIDLIKARAFLSQQPNLITVEIINSSLVSIGDYFYLRNLRMLRLHNVDQRNVEQDLSRGNWKSFYDDRLKERGTKATLNILVHAREGRDTRPKVLHMGPETKIIVKPSKGDLSPKEWIRWIKSGEWEKELESGEDVESESCGGE
ncbi:hypothetical protein P7C73_g1396, partial [Tremellales sp. Uapishka_1]